MSIFMMQGGSQCLQTSASVTVPAVTARTERRGLPTQVPAEFGASLIVGENDALATLHPGLDTDAQSRHRGEGEQGAGE